MHFRHFLITGLMVGAAVFLPDQAFAEKNDLNSQGNSQKVSVQSQVTAKTDSMTEKAPVPAKAESAQSQGKSMVVPSTANTNQGKVNQHTLSTTPSPASTQKAAALPIQAKGSVNSLVKKPEKIVNSHANEHAVAALEKNQGALKGKVNATSNADVHSSHNKALLKNDAELTENIPSLKPQQKGSHVSPAYKESSFEPLVQEPPQSEGQTPVSEEDIPKVSQVLNPSQRSSNSGGPSNDRGNQGFSTQSMMDKWFEWNSLFEIKLVQPFHSRFAWMIHQWVNAPPSPPPQIAPLLETVTRS